MMGTLEEHVHYWYWEKDVNCARTTLLYLAHYFGVSLCEQTLHAGIGMHGAGGFGAQCGLVEGSLMFMGIYFARKGLSDSEISRICCAYAKAFSLEFSSLECRVLRPEGFLNNTSDHICEDLTVRSIAFTCDFIEDCAYADIAH